MLPDERLAIGAMEVPGLWIAAGHYRNGVLLTPLTASLLSAAILGESAEDAALLRAFSPNAGNAGGGDVLVESPAA